MAYTRCSLYAAHATVYWSITYFPRAVAIYFKCLYMYILGYRRVLIGSHCSLIAFQFVVIIINFCNFTCAICCFSFHNLIATKLFIVTFMHLNYSSFLIHVSPSMFFHNWMFNWNILILLTYFVIKGNFVSKNPKSLGTVIIFKVIIISLWICHLSCYLYAKISWYGCLLNNEKKRQKIKHTLKAYFFVSRQFACLLK